MIGHPYIRDITRHPDADVINPQLDCIDFIKEIISSEIVLSQSLHGLVFAQLFGKPSAWFSHTLEDAWLFKFRDWFSTTIDPPAAPAFFGTPLDALLRSARLPGLAVDREALRSALPRLTTMEREPGVGFRETRRLAPLTIHVTSNVRAPVSSNYDATIMCRSGDEAALQNALHVQARRFDDSFSLWLVFDPVLFAAFSGGEMQHYRALLDEAPDTHYLSILPEGAGSAEPGHWRGVVLVRSPHEFSFSARGQKVFRKARDLPLRQHAGVWLAVEIELHIVQIQAAIRGDLAEVARGTVLVDEREQPVAEVSPGRIALWWAAKSWTAGDQWMRSGEIE